MEGCDWLQVVRQKIVGIVEEALNYNINYKRKRQCSWVMMALVADGED